MNSNVQLHKIEIRCWNLCTFHFLVIFPNLWLVGLLNLKCEHQFLLFNLGSLLPCFNSKYKYMIFKDIDLDEYFVATNHKCYFKVTCIHTQIMKRSTTESSKALVGKIIQMNTGYVNWDRDCVYSFAKSH